MSETQARSSVPRGRGSGRGGRGGYISSRGGRSKHANGDTIEPAPKISYEEQGEIGQLKKKYGPQLITVKEMFPDWTEDDIVFALEESNGDMERTVERMTEGTVSQWGEVKKKNKDKLTSKSKDAGVDSAEGFSRGGRSRGGDVTRGGRSRGIDRGRGRGRARDNAGTRVKPAEISSEAPLVSSDSWSNPTESQPIADGSNLPASTISSEESGWDVVNPADAIPPAVEAIQSSSKPDGTRTWASMFAQKPAPVTPVQKPIQKTQPSEAPPAVSATPESQLPIPFEEPPVEEADSTLPPSAPDAEPAVEVAPSEDQLTESNLQQVPGSPQEPATTTVVSNAGTNEIRTAGALTPVPGSVTNQPSLRPGLGGFQTSALKATTPTPRSSSFARRVKEQQEAVVMPGNHAVDRAAVQFGSLGLGNGSADFEMDDDREQPETREQPPQHSPVAPKASLPAVSQPAQPDSTKATSNLTAAPGSQPSATPDQQASQPSGQSTYSYNQFGYGHPGQIGDNNTAQKGYEAFGQQAAQTAVGSLNGYPSHSQTPNQPSQTTHQSQIGGYSSAANDYSSYYTSDPQRNAYNVYGSYGQTQVPQDSTQKSATSFGVTSASELPATVATSQAALPGQTRFGAMDQNSGHSTPNPQNAAQAQTQNQSQGQQAQQVSQGHGNQHAGYPYGTSNPYYGNYYPNYMGQHNYGRSDRPPFDDVRRYEEQYLSQTHHYGYGANQGAYGAGPYGGKYGQPHQGYGMPSQAWDTHAGSPANTGSYGQQPAASRDNTAAHNAYGRAGSTQPTEGQQQGATAFGGMTDVFGRSGSVYSNQTSHQQTQQGIDDTSRAYDNSSKATGPSPVSGQAAGRPSSAVNAQGQTSQAQNQQQNYGGYPSHSQQSHYGSNYGHQSTTQGHQTSGYGAYAGFGGNYYGNNSRGNWGGSYNH